jgi:hypothetical protein
VLQIPAKALGDRLLPEPSGSRAGGGLPNLCSRRPLRVDLDAWCRRHAAHERDDLSVRHDPLRNAENRKAARSGREVLAAVNGEIRLDRKWSDGELDRARALSHDVRIAQALHGTDNHGLAEVMAAGPQLLTEWLDARSTASRMPRHGRTAGDPRGAALVAAAVDLQRAGCHRPVPISILRELHTELSP